MDMKTILLIVALGGSNALQALGFTVPAEKTKAEVMATAEFMREELHACQEKLFECMERCAR